MDMYDWVPPDNLMPFWLAGALKLEKSFRLLAFKLVLATLPPERSVAAVTYMFTGLETDRMLPPLTVMALKQYVPPASVVVLPPLTVSTPVLELYVCPAPSVMPELLL